MGEAIGFIGQLIRLGLIFVFLCIFFFCLYKYLRFFKKFKAFRQTVRILEAYRKLKRGDFTVEEKIKFPLMFFSSTTLLLAFIFFLFMCNYLLGYINGIFYDKKISFELNAVFAAVFLLLFLWVVVIFLKSLCTTILYEDGIKIVKNLRSFLTFGKFHFFRYDEIDSMEIKLTFRRAAPIGAYSVGCKMTIDSVKGKFKFDPNPGHNNDTLLLIAALKEKLRGKVKVSRK